MGLRIWLVLCLIELSLAGKSVDLLASAGLSVLEEEQILRVLSRNETGSSENYTFVELISSLRNNTILEGEWKFAAPDLQYTNPYYDEFPEKIDYEARSLLQIVPAYDPGAGHVSAKCKRHADIFHRELAKFSLWALKMYDATAKMPSGLLSGNVNQFGDFDECIGVEGSEGIKGQYCLAYLQLDVEDTRPDLKHLHRLLHAHYMLRSNQTDPGHRVPRFSSVQWAVCTPASCTPRDVQTSLQDTLSRYTAETGLKISVQVEPQMCQIKETKPVPTKTILASLFFVAIIILTLVAAYFDHYKIPASEMFLAFSLKRNATKLFSITKGESDIETLHGVRALNAVMLLIAHKNMALFFNPYINRTYMAEYLGKPWTVVGRAASIYTDPFIMLSGLLTTYSFVGRLKRTGNLDIKSEYLSRLLRLVPTLGALILFCTFIMPYTGSGPQWNLVVTEHADICKQTWWRNFLFIHNYFGFENMCLTHTHHLGIDTQLFALSPLMVLLLYKKPMIGTAVLTIVAIFSTALRYFVTYYQHLSNYIYFSTSVRQLFDTANLSYILPSHRLTVYILGIFVGYVLRYMPKGYKVNNTVQYAGWTLCTVMFLAAFIGPATMGSIDYVYNPMHAAMYNAFAPLGWCALFAWVAVMHHTGNTNGWLSKFLAWRGFTITTKLSYTVYLTQFPVYFYNVGQTRSAENYEFIRMVFNWHELLWITISSIVLTLLFDTPFQNIKNYLLKKPALQERGAKPSKVE
ncbi:hypothetical protein KM043_009961 [Ampulex compressa]|nr:hypothetical protein KM043_009961 [Ampulex compressa]